MAEFGEQLKKAREEKGMTQQTLADNIFVTRQTVSRWELGERFPDILTLKKLSDVLSVSTDELLSVDDIPHIVEKNSIIEKPIVKNMLTVLYTSISVVFAIKAVTQLLSPNLVDGLLQGQFYSYFMFFISFAKAILFCFSFVYIVNDRDTPRKNGMVIFLFFFLELCSRLHILFNRTMAGTITALISFIPFIIGCAGAYIHFITIQKNKYGHWLIYSACVWLAFIELLNLSIIATRHISFINITFILEVILKIIIYGTFSYQAYLLNRRRKLAEGFAKERR